MLRFRIQVSKLEEDAMPDDQTLATILAICELIKGSQHNVQTAVGAYERAMKEVLQYRRTQGLTEVGGVPATD